jgi:drug/metabolite transporter (DMT)-like permease
LLIASPAPDLYFLLLGAAAGIFYFLGLAALYKSLASGPMGIVAPFTAVIAAVLPVLFAMFWEGFPSSMQAIGFVAAFGAIWLLSVPEESHKITWRKFGLPAVAGLCFGFTFIFIDGAADQGVLWPLVAARCSGMVALFIFLSIFRVGSLPPKNKYPLACLSGIFDTAGTALFALAAQAGRLDISAVLASMYPATTVMFARLILKERLSFRQWTGVAAALIALVLIAS